MVGVGEGSSEWRCPNEEPSKMHSRDATYRIQEEEGTGGGSQGSKSMKEQQVYRQTRVWDSPESNLNSGLSDVQTQTNRSRNSSSENTAADLRDHWDVQHVK